MRRNRFQLLQFLQLEHSYHFDGEDEIEMIYGDIIHSKWSISKYQTKKTNTGYYLIEGWSSEKSL